MSRAPPNREQRGKRAFMRLPNNVLRTVTTPVGTVVTGQDITTLGITSQASSNLMLLKVKKYMKPKEELPESVSTRQIKEALWSDEELPSFNSEPGKTETRLSSAIYRTNTTMQNKVKKMEIEDRPRGTVSSKSCQICAEKLTKPYIKCSQCPGFLQCLNCFIKGACLGKHENDHSYEIMREKNFRLWDDDQWGTNQWTAEEELKLLQGIDDCGLGNWLNVGTYLHKPARECESHYMHYYVEHPQEPLQLSTLSGGQENSRESGNNRLPPLVPYRVSNDPPRPQLDSSKHAEMAGYYAARGDFITEYNNFAEMNLKDVEFSEDDDDFDRDLKLATVDIYNHQLKERARRKRLLRRYGMIDIQQAALVWQQRYEHTIGRDVLNVFRPLMSKMKAEQFECLLESLHYEMELRQKIVALQEYRKCGLTTLTSAKLYHTIKQRREKEKAKRTSAIAQLKCEAGSSTLAATESHAVLPGHTVQRRSAPPINVVGLPGYEKLNAKERELCSTARIVPTNYLEFKNILINENLRCGRLRLAQARHLIKIDVNKTRKLYDFLVQEGSITKDS